MKAVIRPSAEMKGCNIEFLNNIPSSWKVTRLSRSNWIRSRLGWKGLKADEYVESGFPFLSAFNIVQDHLSWNDLNYISQYRYDESPEIKLSKGDILLVKDGAGIGKCARVDSLPVGESTVNSSLAVISPCSLLSYRFEYYYLLSPIFQNIIARLKNGMGVPHLTQEAMKEIYVPLPPMKEQEAIANYLDDRCSKIDEIIAEATASIEEYKELKQAVIFEAVTQGLDKNTELYSTGNLWIPQIPSGLRLSRVSRHYQIVLGKMLCPAKRDSSDSLEPYFCAANVHFDGISGEIKEMWFNNIEKEMYRVHASDMLIVEGGAGAGGAAIVSSEPERDTYVQNSIMIVRSKDSSDNRYLCYLLQALVKNKYIEFVCNKATIPHFTKEKVSRIPYPVWNLDMRERIADYLDEQTSQIDNLISEKQSLIEDLQAYKKSLIYEIVTGKRRVV